MRLARPLFAGILVSLAIQHSCPSADGTQVPPAAAKHYEAGMALKKSGELKQAAGEFKAAIQAHPDYLDAHWALAWTYAGLGQDQEAVLHFGEVIRLADPGSEKAREARAAMERLGKTPPKPTRQPRPPQPAPAPASAPPVSTTAVRGLETPPAPSQLKVNEELVARVVPLGQTCDPMEGNLAWSPDGTRVAFLKGYPVDFTGPMEATAGGEETIGTFTMSVTVGDLWIANADGANPRELTRCDTTRPFEEAEYALGVRWSPDGKTLAYVYGSLFASGQIVLCDPATGTSTKLPYGTVLSPTVSWSPDGRKLAFTGGEWKAMVEAMEAEEFEEAQVALAVVDADGRGYRKLYDEAEGALDLGWSPDGNQVLFGRWESMDGPGHLWVVGADGTGARQLALNAGSTATWSPDGTAVAYADEGDAEGLWLMTLATGKRRQLVENTVGSVRWPQHGTGIFYGASTPDGGRAFLLRTADEKHLQLTTAGDVCGLYPSPDGKQVAVVVTEAEGTGVDVRDRNNLYILTLKGEALSPGR
jgi:Tol biopolymer transport system component